MLGAFFFILRDDPRGRGIKRSTRTTSRQRPARGTGSRWRRTGSSRPSCHVLLVRHRRAEYLLGGQRVRTRLPGSSGATAAAAETRGAASSGAVQKMPRLITTGEEVKPGTNGRVTTLGLCERGGGFAVGLPLCGGCSPPPQRRTRWLPLWPVLVIGLGGVVGSLMDSLLGATIQFKGYCSERRRMVSKPGPTVTVSGLNFLSNSRQLCQRSAR